VPGEGFAFTNFLYTNMFLQTFDLEQEAPQFKSFMPQYPSLEKHGACARRNDIDEAQGERENDRHIGYDAKIDAANYRS
jgi:hypothetical protein